MFPLDGAWDITVCSGGANGADKLGERFARDFKLQLRIFEADWGGLGKSAGPVRNREMAEWADTLVAYWDGKSRGTKNMISEALKNGLEVHVFRY